MKAQPSDRCCSFQERTRHVLTVTSVLVSLESAGAFVTYRGNDHRSLVWNPVVQPRQCRLTRWRSSATLAFVKSASFMADNLLSSDSDGEQIDKSVATPRAYPSLGQQGLSKFHQSILSRSTERQRLVTGKDPLLITVEDNPTRRWLGLGREQNAATAHLLVNGTTVERSPASFDRFQWIDDDERDELHERYAMVSLELIAEIHMKKPGYVNVLPSSGAGSTAALRRAIESSTAWNRYTGNSVVFEAIEGRDIKPPRDRLWITGFSLASQRGYMHSVDAETGHIESLNTRTSKAILWPNEFNSVPSIHMNTQDSSATTNMKKDVDDDALLVSDGFLVPGKNKGGIYVIKNPGDTAAEWTSCLAGGGGKNHAWFYHR